MISHFFIDRPIFASVLSIVIVVMGLVALQGLPIAQFPEITPPVVQIDADYPGASAEVIADSVARPIEVQLPGIDNLLYYDSTSTNDGHMTIKLTFEIGTNVDIAQVQTQNRQKLAEPPVAARSCSSRHFGQESVAGPAGRRRAQFHRFHERSRLYLELRDPQCDR